MENLIISVHAILPMFLVMALGYGARCLGWIRREENLEHQQDRLSASFCRACCFIMYTAPICPARLIRC